MTGKEQLTLADRGIEVRLCPMARLWFDTYYDPNLSPAENKNQAESAVSNGWQPISWPKELAELG